MLPFSSALFVLPLGTSAVVVGFGILVTYDQDPYDIRSAWWLIPIVHAAIALPFVIRSAIPVLQSVPPELREAASSLGASPTQRFFSIDLPLIRPAITSAIALSGALSLGEFGATSFLTRRDTETLPIAISRLLSRAGSLSFSTAMAAATLLLVLTMAVISLADSGSRR
jgi:thiamine transport system permease protein